MLGELRDVVDALERLTERLEHLHARETETAALLRGLSLNNVLFSGSITIPSSGVWSKDFSVPFAAVGLYATAALTVTNDAGADSAGPGAAGPGICHVPASSFVQRNIAGRTVSIYGAAGTVVDLEVLAKGDTAK